MAVELRTCVLVVSMVLAFAGHAQAIGLAGNYHESDARVRGPLINTPANPPVVPCDASADNARCQFKRLGYFGQGLGRSDAPAVGVPGAASIDGDPRTVGVPFTLPTAFMQQDRSQAMALLGAVAIYYATAFDASAPAARRDRNLGLTSMDAGFVSNPNTRVFAPRTFSTANRSAFGQNNGLAMTDPNYAYRQAADTTVTDTSNDGFARVSVTYRGGSGFSGTAGLLLDGTGDLFLGGPNLDALGTPAQAPILWRNRMGDGVSGNPALRNGMGWDYVVTAVREPGTMKTFGLGSHDPLPGGLCTTFEAPALPPGCNVVVGFDTNGVPGPFEPPGSTTVRHVFPWTTGTVTITARSTILSGALTLLESRTIVGRGHDVTSSFATGHRRSVGLVAGSYSIRTDTTGLQRVDVQLAGMNLVFTPEPSSTIALLVGVGLLGGLAARRGRSIRGD